MASPIPLELTDEQVIQVEALSTFLTLEQIADYFGISRRTFYEMRQRNPEIEKRWRKGKISGIAKVAGALYRNAINGNVASQIFIMKTQGGWKETAVIDNVSSDGSHKSLRQLFEETRDNVEDAVIE